MNSLYKNQWEYGPMGETSGSKICVLGSHWVRRRKQMIWRWFIKFRLSPVATGSLHVRDYWAGKWHDNPWHVSESKSSILQSRAKTQSQRQSPRMLKGHISDMPCPRSSFMCGCGITADLLSVSVYLHLTLLVLTMWTPPSFQNGSDAPIPKLLPTHLFSEWLLFRCTSQLK